MYKISNKQSNQSSQAIKRTKVEASADPSNAQITGQHSTNNLRYTKKPANNTSQVQGVLSKGPKHIYKKKVQCGVVSSTKDTTKIEPTIQLRDNVIQSSASSAPQNITFSSKMTQKEKKCKKRIFIQDLDNLQETSSTQGRNNTSKCSSPMMNNSRINHQESNQNSIHDSQTICLSNMKHQCDDQNQKFKSCVLIPTMSLSRPSDEFENQENKSVNGQQVTYLSIGAGCKNKSPVSRRDSFQMTAASQDDELQNSRDLTDHEHSDVDACSVDMSVCSSNKPNHGCCSPKSQGGLLMAAQLKMSLQAPSFQPSEFIMPTVSKTLPKFSVSSSNFVNSMANSLDSLQLDSNFTPSTPHVHKFRTEMCKIFELHGKCKYGDECSFAHTKSQMMVKTDVSALYKTKLCKKFSANGYCPYGVRCQFIHETIDQSAKYSNSNQDSAQIAEQPQAIFKSKKQEQIQIQYQEAMNEKNLTDKFTDESSEKQNKVAGKQFIDNLNAQVIYQDILVHNVHISVQEYQKKMKMFQKKVFKKRLTETVAEPELQYINIYNKPVKRLGCFADLTNDDDSHRRNKSQDLQQKTQLNNFYGDAQSYEKNLDSVLKQLGNGFLPNSSMVLQNCQDQYYPEEIYDQSFQHENYNNQMMDSSYLSNSNYSNYTVSLNDQKLLKLGSSFKPSQSKLTLNKEATFVPSVIKNQSIQSQSLFDSMLPSFESLISESVEHRLINQGIQMRNMQI